MQIYCPEFSVMPDNSPYPRPAVSYTDLQELLDDYEQFCRDCDRWGQEPAPVWVFAGIPSGDESSYGYPDYPDWIVERKADRIIYRST